MNSLIKEVIIPAMLCSAMALSGCKAANETYEVTSSPAQSSAEEIKADTASVDNIIDISSLFSDRDLDPSYDEKTAVSVKLNTDTALCDSNAVSIDGGKLCNLNLDMGVGKLTLKSRIEGKSDIDYGVGEADLILIGSKDDYTIELDKGIGEAKLEGERMNDDSVYGSGGNRIEIDGGIGSLSIHFSQDETHKAF